MLPFIELGPVKVPSYGLLLCVAILAGVRMAVTRAEWNGLRREFVFSAASTAALAGIVGAKLTDWLLPGPNSWEGMITGGGTFLGGFLSAVLVAYILSLREKAPFGRLGDALAPSLALGVAVVRIGCFAASCDYGKATNLPWGVVFTNSMAARLTSIPLGVRLHPSQLYESALGVLILGLLLILERKPRPVGFSILVFATSYAAGRFLLEFLRGDVDRGFWGPLSVSQWLSLATLTIFAALYFCPVRRSRASRK